MPRISTEEISSLLHEWSDGNQSALDKLIPLVHDELHRLAHQYMLKENAGHILQTTALVNEAYLRLVAAGKTEWKDRAHFFAISANIMRHILVDFARARRYGKRSGRIKRVTLHSGLLRSPGADPDIIQIDDALNALSKFDPRKAKVVELRYFGGLSLEETAEVLKVSTDTVKRDWRMAKVWLLTELKDRKRHES